MWGCFLMSGVKILHFLKDWWKSIPIHQNYTMALMHIQTCTHRCTNIWQHTLSSNKCVHMHIILCKYISEHTMHTKHTHTHSQTQWSIIHKKQLPKFIHKAACPIKRNQSHSQTRTELDNNGCKWPRMMIVTTATHL